MGDEFSLTAASLQRGTSPSPYFTAFATSGQQQAVAVHDTDSDVICVITIFAALCGG